MRGSRWLAGLLCGAPFSGVAAAEWTGNGTLGGVLARGNTETSTINAIIDVANDLENWTHKAGGPLLRTVTDTETTKFEGQIGAGFRQTELRITGDTSEDAIVRGALTYEHKLTGTTMIYERLLVESGSDNTYVQNQLGMEVKINDTFALGLDYAVRHNTDVLPGTEETDQVFTVNLVYGF